MTLNCCKLVSQNLLNVKCWHFHRAPFERIYDMVLLRNTLVKLGIDLISACQKDMNDLNPEEKISTAVSIYKVDLWISHTCGLLWCLLFSVTYLWITVMFTFQCHMLADYCDGLIVNNTETLLIQPASLEQTTIRKKQGEELVSSCSVLIVWPVVRHDYVSVLFQGMRIYSAYYGVHIIGEVKDRVGINGLSVL
jgi:hypothetical protein